MLLNIFSNNIKESNDMWMEPEEISEAMYWRYIENDQEKF